MLPFSCSMPLSGKTYPAQVTRLLHSAPVEGLAAFTIPKEIPHLVPHKEQSTFCWRGWPALVHFHLFSCPEAGEMLRHPRAAAPHPWSWDSGGRRAVRSGKRLHSWAPFCSLCDRPGCMDLPWASTDTWSPGASPTPPQLALPAWLSGGFCTHGDDTEASAGANCWQLPTLKTGK